MRGDDVVAIDLAERRDGPRDHLVRCRRQVKARHHQAIDGRRCSGSNGVTRAREVAVVGEAARATNGLTAVASAMAEHLGARLRYVEAEMALRPHRATDVILMRVPVDYVGSVYETAPMRLAARATCSVWFARGAYDHALSGGRLIGSSIGTVRCLDPESGSFGEVASFGDSLLFAVAVVGPEVGSARCADGQLAQADAAATRPPSTTAPTTSTTTVLAAQPTGSSQDSGVPEGLAAVILSLAAAALLMGWRRRGRPAGDLTAVPDSHIETP